MVGGAIECVRMKILFLEAKSHSCRQEISEVATCGELSRMKRLTDLAVRFVLVLRCYHTASALTNRSTMPSLDSVHLLTNLAARSAMPSRDGCFRTFVFA